MNELMSPWICRSALFLVLFGACASPVAPEEAAVVADRLVASLACSEPATMRFAATSAHKSYVFRSTTSQSATFTFVGQWADSVGARIRVTEVDGTVLGTKIVARGTSASLTVSFVAPKDVRVLVGPAAPAVATTYSARLTASCTPAFLLQDWARTDLPDVLRDYTVEFGTLHFITLEDCQRFISKYGQCWGNNPATHYGMYYFDDGDDDEPLNWRLGPDEAVILIGTTPPPARYVGVRSYLFSRHRSHIPNFDTIDPQFIDGDRMTIMGDIGYSLNNASLKTAGGDGAFGARTVVITSGNQNVSRDLKIRIEAALRERGLTDDIFNADSMSVSAPLFLDGGAARDKFSAAFRYTMPSDALAAEQFVQAPTLTLLRVRARTAPAMLPYPDPRRGLTPIGATESSLAPKLRQLATAVSRVLVGRVDAPIQFHRPGNLTDLYTCINTPRGCGARNTDALYVRPTVATKLTDPLSEEGFYVVGINHSRVQPYSYNSMSARNPGKAYEVAYASDVEYGGHPHYLQGSLDYYFAAGLPAEVQISPSERDSFYIFRFARKCGVSARYCAEVPSDALGIAPGEQVQPQERIYFDLETQTAPRVEEIVPPYMVLGRGLVAEPAE